MIRLKITMGSGAFVTRDCQTQKEADEYLEYISANCNWGKPERWIASDKAIEGALDSRIIVSSREPESSYTEYKLASEYFVEASDITNEVEQEKINQEALEYLVFTDWMVIKSIETGVSIPEEIKNLRAEARLRIIKQ